MFGDGYVAGPQDASRGRMLEKQREAMFQGVNAEKDREQKKTNDYRLKSNTEKFASKSEMGDALLVQQTVGLQTKEEYGRKKRELEEGLEPQPAAEPVLGEPKDKKKKKKAKEKGALSFAMDDDDAEGGEDAPEFVKKPKANPTVAFVPAVEKAKEEAAAKPPPKEAASSTAPVTKLPEGYSCVKLTSDSPPVLELSLEVFASANAPKSKVTAIGAQSIAMTVQGTERGGEANRALCAYLKAVLGGDAVNVEVVRGFAAPVKAVKVTGVESQDAAYHRLLVAQKLGK